MRRSVQSIILGGLAAAFALATVGFGSPSASAQGASMQQKVAQIKTAMAKNKQMLAQYTWQEQETVSVRGDVKKQALYQVVLGANGQAVKTDITQSQSSGRTRGIRARIAQNYEDYGKQIAALAASYMQADPASLQTLYAQGKVSVGSAGPGLSAITVKGYVKPGDTVTITFDPAQKAVVSIRIASYLSDPSDGVTIAASFAKLPDGTNHASTVQIDGQSKSLVVQETNLNYQKRA